MSFDPRAKSAMTAIASNPFIQYWEQEATLLQSAKTSELQGAAGLSLGCGYFREIALLAKLGLSPIVGVEISQSIISDGRSEARMAGGLYCAADMRRLPFADSTFGFACILFNTLGNLEQQWVVLAEAHRVLRPKAILAVSVWSASEPARAVRMASYTRFEGRTIHERNIAHARSVWWDIFDHGQLLWSSMQFDAAELEQMLADHALSVERRLESPLVRLFVARKR